MASLMFDKVYINDAYSLAGPMEKKGSIKKYDKTINDYYFGMKTPEQAEVKMQKHVLDSIMQKNKLSDSSIDCLIAGELSNQLSITSFNASSYNIPFLGVYSACASYPESLLLMANLINSNQMNRGIVLTSSHNLNSEKQFRFPIEYGAPKPGYSTFTATGCVANIVSNKKSKIRIDSATIGRVVDYGTKDASNMGAVMAPAAADVLAKHLKETKRKSNYYDLILTGDLGEVGATIFQEFLRLNYNIELNNHMDAACEIYHSDQKSTVNAGASGPAALPLVLWNKVIQTPKFKKILIIGTGSLHSPVMVNQKLTIPSIAHAVSLEVQ